VKFGLFVDQDTTRYCYLRLRRLKAAIKDARVVDALVEELEVPGATGKRKMAAIERRIEELRATKDSLWHGVPAPEILAASIFKARERIGSIVDELFTRVPRVQDLSAPLVQWLDLAGLKCFEGGVPGVGRANVVGCRGGQFLAGLRVVAIEATNDTGQLERALEEMKSSRELANASYIACTPALAAEYLWAQITPGSRWGGDALRRRFQESGFGLLLVEGDAVAQAIPARERKQDRGVLAQLALAVQSRGTTPR